jgi:ankyrin repeat protein
MKYFKGYFILLMLFSISVISYSCTDSELNAKLLDAASKGNRLKVKVLIEEGADLNAKDNQLGLTALIVASQKGHTETVKVLIEEGADLNMKNNDNRTALDYAKLTGNKKIVNLFLQKTNK